MSGARRGVAWTGLGRAERLVGGVALGGLALALGGLVAILVGGPGRLALAAFGAGYTLLALAMLAGLFVLRALPALARPLHACGLGFLLVALAALLGRAGHPWTEAVRLAGSTVLAAGLLWGLWTLGGLRR